MSLAKEFGLGYNIDSLVINDSKAMGLKGGYQGMSADQKCANKYLMGDSVLKKKCIVYMHFYILPLDLFFSNLQ